jgi:exopolysaccharide biosynthesis polyprenyl glycosylphosphotransferase
MLRRYAMMPWRPHELQRAQAIDRAIDAVLPAAIAAVVLAPRGAAVAVAVAAIATVTWLFMSRLLRQYDATNGRGFTGDLALTCVLLASMVAVPWLAAQFGVLPAESTQLGRFGAWLLATSVPARLLLVGAGLWRARAQTRDVIVMGVGPLGRHTGNELIYGDGRRRLVGYLRFEDEPPNDRLHAELLGGSRDLERVLRERAVDEVYLASTAPAHASAMQMAIETCERFGTPFALPVCPYRVSRAHPENVGAVQDGYVHYLEVPSNRLQHALKRGLDILVSGVALLALSPVLIITAICVKSTPGPVLFRQERVGLAGRRFHMLKFRSMVVDAEACLAKLAAHNEQTGPVFKMTRDPRVTRVGRFIRKFSIDELPQLVNVLRGDMSLVGPRPALPSEVARYEAWQLRRLSVRPGLTCVWQVSGRNAIGFEQWMLLDLRYIDHWTLASDLALIARTVPVVLSGRGAS